MNRVPSTVVSGYEAGRVPAVVVGVESLERLDGAVGRSGASSAVIVADEAVVSAGYVGRVREALDHPDVEIRAVDPGEPTAASVDAVADSVRLAPTPLVVAVGGGSALDTAKLAAAIGADSFGVEHYALAAHALPRGRPVIAVPTTAGTGAEVTRTCVVTDRIGRKVWAWGDELLPMLVLLDPAATATMPAHVTVATGLDAFVHAMEAVTGRRRTAFVAAPALQALRLVLDHLPQAVRHSEDLGARQAMQEAALLAGVAIDSGGTGVAHAIGHALGTLAHVPHGVAVAVGLAASLAWSVEGCPEAYASVARALGVPVDAVPEVYAALLEASGLPAAVGRLRPLDVRVEDLADHVVAEENQPMYHNNCRVAAADERRMLAEATVRVWDELRRSGAAEA